jgi:hypothetical protein
MFSFIKTLRADPGRIFPDRGLVGMDQPFLRAYTQVGRQGWGAPGGIPILHKKVGSSPLQYSFNSSLSSRIGLQ